MRAAFENLGSLFLGFSCKYGHVLNVSGSLTARNDLLIAFGIRRVNIWATLSHLCATRNRPFVLGHQNICGSASVHVFEEVIWVPSFLGWVAIVNLGFWKCLQSQFGMPYSVAFCGTTTQLIEMVFVFSCPAIHLKTIALHLVFSCLFLIPLGSFYKARSFAFRNPSIPANRNSLSDFIAPP